MSDEEHHFESKADAGASKTYPQQAGTIRKNGYIVIKNRPCKVLSPLFFSFFLCSCYGFYLGFCFFFPDLSVLFVNWLISHAIYKGDFLKKNQKVIFIRANTWICLELIISFWGCFKKKKRVDFDVDGVSWELFFSCRGFVCLKICNF
jgi:hypothetical protein